MRQADQQGYRSRSAFKLLQLDDRYRLLRPGLRVVELGAAPGGWTQIVLERTRPQDSGKLVVVDRVAMHPLPGSELLTADVLADDIAIRIRRALGDASADLMLSDASPSASGHAILDRDRSARLAEAVYHCARAVLAPGGSLVCKMFQGHESEDLLVLMRENFNAVHRAKPAASRSRCSEFYLVAKGFIATEPHPQSPAERSMADHDAS